MRFFCRENHDEEPERCPPHEFEAAGFDNPAGLFQARIFCKACGDIRELEVPMIGPVSIEARSESEG